MEYFDVYDINRKKTGKIIKRGDRLQKGEYHLFVQVWIMNSDGLFLSEQRSKNKTYPLVWCASGGNAIVGEDGLACAIREIKEELGIDIREYDGGLFDSRVYEEDNQSYFCDSFLYYIDKPAEEYIIQREEIEKVEYKSMDEIRQLMKENKYFVYDEDYLSYLEEKSKEIRNKKSAF